MILPFALENLRTRWYGFFLVRLRSAIVASCQVLWLGARFGCNPKGVPLKVMTDFSDEGKELRIQSSPLPNTEERRKRRERKLPATPKLPKNPNCRLDEAISDFNLDSLAIWISGNSIPPSPQTPRSQSFPHALSEQIFDSPLVRESHTGTKLLLKARHDPCFPYLLLGCGLPQDSPQPWRQNPQDERVQKHCHLCLGKPRARPCPCKVQGRRRVCRLYLPRESETNKAGWL